MKIITPILFIIVMLFFIYGIVKYYKLKNRQSEQRKTIEGLINPNEINAYYLKYGYLKHVPGKHSISIGHPGMHNSIYIGRNTGKYIMSGSYNIIIADSVKLMKNDGSYLFLVDHSCSFLKNRPELSGYLKAVYDFGLNPDDGNRKKRRIEIIKSINKNYLSK